MTRRLVSVTRNVVKTQETNGSLSPGVMTMGSPFQSLTTLLPGGYSLRSIPPSSPQSSYATLVGFVCTTLHQSLVCKYIQEQSPVAAGNSNADACGFTPAFAPSAITVGASSHCIKGPSLSILVDPQFIVAYPSINGLIGPILILSHGGI